MDDVARALEIRARAERLREQGHKLRARADALAPGTMRDMLTGQAAILVDGAGELETRALEMMPTLGST